LEEVAAATPAPGGGTSVAWTCALAAALVQMASAFAGPGATEVVSRASALRERALALGEQELRSYEPVLEALKLPRDDPERPSRLDAALSVAAEAPLELARAGAEIADLARQAARSGSVHLRGDAEAGLLLAEAACQAAANLVEINLAGRADDERLEEAASLRRSAAALRAEVVEAA
jgi:methenyltetrahydrofolate cyclohydrolase